MNHIRTHLLDASVLVKLVSNEHKSEVIKSYLNSEHVFWTTSFCFSEALGVLKTKHYYRKVISHDEYVDACFDLVSLFRNNSVEIHEVDITNYLIYDETERLSRKYNLDISDCFQIVTLKDGISKYFAGESKTILITADEGLAKMAQSECIRVWDIINESEPKIA